MNGYELSRKWFDWCFENPEKISPNHTAIYFFAIEHCNRLGWKKKFGFPSQMTMDALGIKKHQTYIKYFYDIVNWGGFTLIQKSKNQYSANIISINAMPINSKALDKALIKHRAKQTETKGQSIGQSNSSINKQRTKNKEQRTINIPVFEEFKNYALENDKNVNLKSIELKYKAWRENDWKDGNNKKIINWKTKLLNTITYLPKNEEKGGFQNNKSGYTGNKKTILPSGDISTEWPE